MPEASCGFSPLPLTPFQIRFAGAAVFLVEILHDAGAKSHVSNAC